MHDLPTSINDAREEQIELRRPNWIGGVPTAADLNAVDRHVAIALRIDLATVLAVPRRRWFEVVG
ncbi:hypothetical protein [Frigidibacter oleivorans]|uniref:hypothetical protein n=1 Tax=Frigidibacter oleivorans TaxID=2487129 RepID=UPI000F8ED233|nr:hypothetical protein [Frigidibacter oleivorans]